MSTATLEPPRPLATAPEHSEANLPDEVRRLLDDPEKLKQLLAAVRPERRRLLSSTSSLPNFPLADLPLRVKKLEENIRALGPLKTEAETREHTWRNEVCEHLKASQLPKRFWFEVEKWHRNQKKAFDLCHGRLKRVGAIIALVGPRGTGKTTIASQLLIGRAWDESLEPWERRPPYRKAITLMSKLKPMYSDFGSIQTENLRQYLHEFCRLHPLVIIDETGECMEMKAWDRLLTDILDRRYANQNDTVLISNQTPEDFMAQTNPSTLSRLEEHGEIIVCDWKSFRTKPAFSVVREEAV